MKTRKNEDIKNNVDVEEKIEDADRRFEDIKNVTIYDLLEDLL